MKFELFIHDGVRCRVTDQGNSYKTTVEICFVRLGDVGQAQQWGSGSGVWEGQGAGEGGGT